MSRSTLKILAVTFAAASALLGPAQGARASVIFDWSYAGNNGGPVSASGTVTTTPDGVGVYQVTAITGERNGVPITGLATYAGDDQLVYTPAANLYGVDAAVDYPGLAYEVGGVAYNVYYFPLPYTNTDSYWCGGYGYCEVGPSSEGIPSGIVTSFTLTAVPEPSTWAMMIFGFAGLGFAGYRASRKSVGVAA
jgi:hypothetical protein